jgi:hypothetical protein
MKTRNQRKQSMRQRKPYRWVLVEGLPFLRDRKYMLRDPEDRSKRITLKRLWKVLNRRFPFADMETIERTFEQ